MNFDKIGVPIIVGGLTAAILKFTQSSNTMSAGDIIVAGVSKKPGDTVTITMSYTNSGDALNGSWGATFLDSNGVYWNYNGVNVVDLIADPAGVVKFENFPAGNGTKTLSCKIPAAFGRGDASLRVSIWKEQANPPTTRLADSGWLGSMITVPQQFNISITGINVT